MAETATGETLCEAFLAIAEMGAAMGVRDICKLPGAWELQIDDSWYVAVNAHAREVAVKPAHSAVVSIPAYYMAVWFNGWPAGLISARGGTIAAGEAANEDIFIAAVRERTRKEKP